MEETRFHERLMLAQRAPNGRRWRLLGARSVRSWPWPRRPSGCGSPRARCPGPSSSRASSRSRRRAVAARRN